MDPPSPVVHAVPSGRATAIRPSAELPRSSPNVPGASHSHVSSPTMPRASGLCRTWAPGGARFPYASWAWTISGRGCVPPVCTHCLVNEPLRTQIITCHCLPGSGSVVGSASGTTLVVYAQGTPPEQKYGPSPGPGVTWS